MKNNLLNDNEIIDPQSLRGINSEDLDESPYDEKYKDLWGMVLLPLLIIAIILVAVVLLFMGAIKI